MAEFDDMEKGQGSFAQPPPAPTPTSRTSTLLSKFRRFTFSSKSPTLTNENEDSSIGQQSHTFVRRLIDCREGYPRLAAFQDSDECFMTYRRFGYLQARVLSDKQDQLRELEEDLAELDDELFDDRDTNPTTRVHIRDPELRERRSKLMEKITKTYCSYSELLIAASQVVALHRPSRKDYLSVLSFCTTEPLFEDEAKWIEHKEDLITLKPGREHAWLDNVIEHLLKLFHCRIIERIFCSSDTRRKVEGRTEGKEVYYTKSRIEVLVNAILLLVILVLLILPTYLLYHLVEVSGSDRADAACMCVLLVATLAFSAVLAVFTRARRHEILAAAAAYCAVLVVFLGNVPQGSSNPLVAQGS